MEGARADDDSALQLSAAEIIIISDDESEDCGEQTNNTDLEPILWTEMADRLLILAKNRKLQDNQEIVATLLRNCGIPPSVDVQHSLRASLDELRQLLLFLRGHSRRERACEDLVLVLCEVLSLVQTAPYKLRYGREPWIKEEKVEIRNKCAMDIAYQLMDRWRVLLVQCARSSGSRSFAIGLTMSRLETLSAKCLDDSVRLRNIMLKHEQEMESATEEWAETMKTCRRDLEPQWIDANERDWKVYDDTFNRTGAVRTKFEDNNKARKVLMHRVQEKELRSKFYRATIKLVCAASQITSIYNQLEQHLQTASDEQMNVLGNEILENMDTFCGALQVVMAPSSRYHRHLTGRTDVTEETAAARIAEHMDRFELINFAKNFEAFWLIHRSWLPQGVLDLVIRSFGTMCGANTHERLSELNATSGCRLRSAISRVCVGLQAGW